MFIYDIHDHKLWNAARWQEPAFHKASDLTMIHLWSLCGNAPALSPIKYILVDGQICTDLKQHFVTHKKIVDGQVLVHGLRLSEYQ